jgi:hypothetical protein
MAGTVSTNTCLSVVTFIATQGSSAFYQSPGVLVVNCQVSFAYDREMYFLLWQPSLPAAWSLTSASGSGNPQISDGQVVFDGPFPNPLNFSYTANIPGGQTGTQQLYGDGVYYLSDMTNTAFAAATPDSLLVNYGTLLSLLMQNGKVELTLQGNIGSSYRIQSSTNLQNWINVLTLTPLTDGLQTNLPATNKAMFYRAVSP